MRNLKDLTFQRREEADWTHRKPDQMPAVKKKCIPKTKFSFFWGALIQSSQAERSRNTKQES